MIGLVEPIDVALDGLLVVGHFWGGRAPRPFIGRVVAMCAGMSVTRPCRFR